MLGNFIRKELREGVRAPEVWGLMIIFPIVLIILLSNAFSLQFDTNIEFEETEYGLVANDRSYITYLTEAVGDYPYIKLTELDEAAALAKAANSETAGYIVLNEQGIVFHDNEQGGSQTMVLESFLEVFVDKYQLGVALQKLAMEGKINPANIPPQSDAPYVQVTGLDGRDQGGPYDYFGVTMLTLILAYVATMTYGYFDDERRGHTLARLKTTPTPPLALFAGKITGVTLISMLQIIILMAVNILFFQVNYGNVFLTFAAMFCLGFVFMAFGTLMAMFVPNSAVANGIIMFVVQGSIIVGGSYFTISPEMGVLYSLQKVSPIGMVNTGMQQAVWGDSNRTLLMSIALNAGIGIVLLLISALRFRDMEVKA